MAALARKWTSFRRLSTFEQVWLVPTWVLLGASRAAIRTVEFRRLASLLGAGASAAPSVPLTTPAQQHRAALVGRTVRVAARYCPWDANCYAQAVTARILLGAYRVPYSLFFGVARGDPATADSGLRAHAWVASGPVRVTGGDGFRAYTAVGTFVSRLPNRPSPPC